MNLSELQNIDSIIFDLDGTLWDASDTCAQAWNRTLSEYYGNGNNSLDADTVRSFSGMKMDDIMEKHFGFISIEEQPEVLKRYKVYENEYIKEYGGKLYPDIQPILKDLAKKYNLFIVSNCLSGYIENFLSFHHLENLFVDFECSGNTSLSKDRNIQMIIKRNQLKNTVYIGDTVWDCEAAAKTGIPFIYAGYGFGKLTDDQTSIRTVKDLKKIFQTG